MTLGETLRDRRILTAIAGWTVLNVVLALGAAGLTEAAGIAWEAHLGGFYAGLLLYGLWQMGAFQKQERPWHAFRRRQRAYVGHRLLDFVVEFFNLDKLADVDGIEKVLRALGFGAGRFMQRHSAPHQRSGQN